MCILLSLAAWGAEPEVVATAPFTLSAPYQDEYRADHPLVSRGSLVFLRVAAGSYQPRAVDSPVLYAGPRPAAVAARSDTCLVAIVSSDVDLTLEPVFFGPADLPERVDARRGAAVRDAALKSGVKPQVRVGARSDATVLHLSDEGHLYEEAARRVIACR
jgi:hypothetical protein